MESGTALLTAWSFALVGAAYLALALRLLVLGYVKAPLDGPRVSLVCAVLLCSLWGWLTLGFLTTGVPLLALLGEIADLLRYAAWFTFVLLIFKAARTASTISGGKSMPVGDGLMPSGMGWMVPVAGLLVAFGLFAKLYAVLGFGAPGEASRLVLFSSMALPVFVLMLVEQLFRNVTEDSRWNVKPLCLALAGSSLFDVYLYSQAVLFNSVDTDAVSIRGAVHTLVVPLLLLASTRRSDWIAKIQVSRKAAFHSATLLIAGIYLIFVSGVGYYVRYFGGEWGRALQLALVFLSLLLLIVLALSGTVRAKLRVFVGKHFFAYRYDYREEWLRFTKTLSSQNSPQEMGQQVVRGLADLLESPGGGLWMKSRSESSFSQTARWNLAQAVDKEDSNSPLCQFMVSSGWVINLEEFRSSPRRYGQLALPVWLQEIEQAWLIVPLNVGEEMIGFVVLARARTRLEVNWEVNDLLKTAGRQAASFLAQMQATEALLEVRKFDAFNRMSAFVVHDLKNIVTQLALMMKNAQRHSQNPEFQQDMLLTVENSLDRMRQLMLQLREGATPPGTAVGVNLSEIVDRIEATAAGRGRKLEVEIIHRIGTRGHEERLERIIGHVVQNAFDATGAAGRVRLSLGRQGGQARIEVADTGQGMSQEFIRDRLFKPFQTTKQAGMGIGAYESFQYVQELGGKIEVDSELNHGTKVTILLPLFELQNESDLHMLESQ
jgi:putative PEP-CTERM system histidine kinase